MFQRTSLVPESLTLMMNHQRFAAAQLGARMHYAVPRILANAGLLDHFFTDICAVRGWPRLLRMIPDGLRPGPVRRLLARVPRGIPSNHITAFNGFGREYARRRSRAATVTDSTEAYLWGGKEFCRLVLSRGLGEARGVYCFNSAGLEILQEARATGRRAATEQTIAPKRIECGLLDTENSDFSDWEASGGNDRAAGRYMEREEAEWHAADLVVCGSEFVRDGIAQCGGPVGKCVVVPYGVEIPTRDAECGMRNAECVRNRPLRVLTVGAVGLRKGSPYVLEAAKRMKGRAEFRMVGSIGVSPVAQAQLRQHLVLTGPVPRSEVSSHFQWADVFLLPSICEGSATVTYEVMASGLPVICTPNTGSVIRDGQEGFIIPIRDSDTLVERLERLAANLDLLTELGRNALNRAQEFTLEAYGRRLIAALTSDR